ncbi:EF-hand domain-containing protein [Citrus sinensis]|nr:EF-hand domain-containing protein [Citrus sinensis]
MKGRISRIGSYAISSSIRDHQQQPCITCTTFNILAPIYKRLSNENCRESDCRAYWFGRNQRILDWLLYERSSIICLQEFWVGNEELVDMYEKRLSDAGYVNFKLARTNNRGDETDEVIIIGLLTAVHKDYFRVVNYRDLLFNDFGDRVAQLLHVELIDPFSQCRNGDLRQEILIVNTHLLFPHDSSLSLVRLHQVYKILQHVESYQKEHNLKPIPIILCGDWNGSKRGHVYKFLRSQGFVSSYDTAHQYTDADAHKWVSHRNHRGNICGVDFIWLLNPNKYRKLLKASWSEAVFGMFKCLLRRASLTETDAFAFLKADNDGDYITYSGFCEALEQASQCCVILQLNLTGHKHGLADEETKDLWVQADIDGNGVVDYKEFQQRIWKTTWSDQRNDLNDEDEDGFVKSSLEQTIGFSVKNAVLFPPEVEKGRKNISTEEGCMVHAMGCSNSSSDSSWESLRFHEIVLCSMNHAVYVLPYRTAPILLLGRVAQRTIFKMITDFNPCKLHFLLIALGASERRRVKEDRDLFSG